MRTHEQIDQRSLRLAQVIVGRIDRDPQRAGLQAARRTCARWLEISPSAAAAEWARILEQPWGQVRAILLRTDGEGCRLRQSSPFCGVLSPRERWAIYREFVHEPPAA